MVQWVLYFEEDLLCVLVLVIRTHRQPFHEDVGLRLSIRTMALALVHWHPGLRVARQLVRRLVSNVLNAAVDQALGLLVIVIWVGNDFPFGF